MPLTVHGSENVSTSTTNSSTTPVCLKAAIVVVAILRGSQKVDTRAEVSDLDRAPAPGSNERVVRGACAVSLHFRKYNAASRKYNAALLAAVVVVTLLPTSTQSVGAMHRKQRNSQVPTVQGLSVLNFQCVPAKLPRGGRRSPLRRIR